MNMKRNILLTVSAVLAAGLLSSCNREAIPAASEGNQFLMLSPALLDMQEDALTTRALSADDLKDDQFNESKVTRLDVFLFKADGTFVKDYHIDGLTPAMIVQRGGKEGYLLSNDWKKDGLDQNVAYKVYVVANSANEAIAAEGATTEAALKALTTVDAAIYKRYLAGAAADNETYSADKTFLMNATVDSWTIQNQATQLIGDETVVLQRAAVKFVMDISLSDKFKARLAADNTEYGTPSWKFVNFNTVTPEIPGTTPEAQLVTRGSGGYLLSAAGETGHFNVTTYAYPQAWTAATANDTAPAILVSYPAVNHTTGYANNHYYYIPLCPDTVTGTQRNKLYKVNAVVSSYGSFETLTNNPVNLTYEVKDWTANEADVNAYATDYLLATPTRYAFKGGNEGEYLSKNFHYYGRRGPGLLQEPGRPGNHRDGRLYRRRPRQRRHHRHLHSSHQRHVPHPRIHREMRGQDRESHHPALPGGLHHRHLQQLEFLCRIRMGGKRRQREDLHFVLCILRRFFPLRR